MGQKEKINPNAKKFEKKYIYKTPAVVEGLTDHNWSLKELLFKRFPKTMDT